MLKENGFTTHYGASASSPATGEVSESEAGDEYLKVVMGDETEVEGNRNRRRKVDGHSAGRSEQNGNQAIM